jgi:hypothetical protein
MQNKCRKMNAFGTSSVTNTFSWILLTPVTDEISQWPTNSVEASTRMPQTPTSTGRTSVLLLPSQRLPGTSPHVGILARRCTRCRSGVFCDVDRSNSRRESKAHGASGGSRARRAGERSGEVRGMGARCIWRRKQIREMKAVRQLGDIFPGVAALMLASWIYAYQLEKSDARTSVWFGSDQRRWGVPMFGFASDPVR